MPSITTPHIPGTISSLSPITIWHMEVPMIITIRSLLVTVAAGTAT
jgi:hypothetical protein